MRLKDIKHWLNSLPEEFMEYQMVNGEGGIVEDTVDDYQYRVDKPIKAVLVDEDTKEIVFTNNPDVPNGDKGKGLQE